MADELQIQQPVTKKAKHLQSQLKYLKNKKDEHARVEQENATLKCQLAQMAQKMQDMEHSYELKLLQCKIDTMETKSPNNADTALRLQNTTLKATAHAQADVYARFHVDYETALETVNLLTRQNRELSEQNQELTEKLLEKTQ